MKNSILILSMTCVIAFSCSPERDTDDPMNEVEEVISEETTGLLDLPTNYYNYANPDLPGHFRAQDVAEIDNTPGNNLVTDAGAFNATQ